ncbi:prepilin-type N-terminal cleavage/methylation domain-containing protein, partial [bacterium]|nr:prepilin-type N-terminal cleavage/methylation domain-containing protein [bacterium]
MKDAHRPTNKKKELRRRQSAGFSMVEIIVVIGIIGVLTGLGAVSYVNQINSSRVSSFTSIVNTNLVQARQMAIAMRQSRRVVIDPGKFDDADHRISPARIWIEGKICEEFDFEGEAFCQSDGGPNNFIITDPDLLPDAVSIVDIGTSKVSDFNTGSDPKPLFIQFNPRGQLSKIYFLDGEKSARPK